MSQPTARRKWLLFAAKIAVTGALFWLIAQKLDLSDVGARLADASHGGLALGAALFGAQLFLNAERWRRLLRLDGATLPYAPGLRFYTEAMFFNQALPGAIGGDLVRIYRVRAFCRGLGQAVNGVVLDRLTGMIGLGILILAGLPLLMQRVGDSDVGIGFAVIFALAAVGCLGLLGIARLPEDGAGGRLRTAAVRFARLFATFSSRPMDAAPVLALSLTTHVLTVAAAYVTARALGLDFGFLDCLIVVPAAIFLSMLPISVGGWGVREGAMAAGFALIGAAPEAAVALSVALGLELLSIGLIGGAVWFLGGSVLPPASVLGEKETSVG